MMAEKKVVKEDGHTDVASAKRQCKTAMEDAQAIIGVLDGMNDEDALPTWWTNKLAIAANSMNKLNDYLSNPTEQKEEVELDEKSQYGPDIKGEISQLQKMLKGLERGKKTPGRGFAKMKIKELIADLEQRQAQDDAVMKMRGEEVELDESVQETEMKDLDNLIEEALNEEVKYPHMMYDPETGKGVEVKTPEEHEKYAEKGYTHEKPELDEMKEPFVVIDTADGNKVVGTASDEKGAKSIISTSQLPPMKIKDKKTLKIVKVKKKQMIGQPLKEETVNEHTHYKMERMGVSRSLVDSVRSVLAGKPQEEALDKVDPKAVKKKFDDRKDKDIDNDGDVDDSDEYLHKRRQAISKAVKGEEKDDKKKDKKDEKNGKKEPIEIDPEIKEDTVKEQEMTDAQMKRREEIVKELKKKEDEFKERYGDRWKEVMYATATKMAMKEAKK